MNPYLCELHRQATPCLGCRAMELAIVLDQALDRATEEALAALRIVLDPNDPRGKVWKQAPITSLT